MDIIDRINLMLAERGMSGAELSRKIGASNSVYSQWNTGTTSPSKKNLVKIAEVLGTSVEYLMGLSEKRENAPAISGKGQKEKPAPISEDGLSDDIKFLLSMYHSVPPEKRAEALAKIANDLKKAGLIE